MICGALWRGDRDGTPPLSGMIEVLRPYGVPTSWAGRVGGLTVAVGRLGGDGEKPVVSPCGAVVCADVFLHDRADLVSTLGAPPSASDAELVGFAYDRWADRICDHLSGAYALSIADPRRGGVFLARDHAGTRFLAVAERGDTTAFASTALALTAFPGVGHELDIDRLTEVVLLGYGTDRTFVRGVKSILPGVSMWIDPDGRRIRRWWVPDPLPIRDTGSLIRQAAELRQALERAVASNLRSVSGVGVLLSGGLDSSSVAAVAARQLAPGILTSYTSVPPPDWAGDVAPNWIADERAAVEALARRLPNLSPRFVDVRGTSLFDHNEAIWELGGGPARNPLNTVWVHECVRHGAADGLTMLLTGASGNHGFSADGPLWLAELTRRLRFTSVLSEAKAWKRVTGKSVPATLRGNVLWPLLPARFRQRRAVAQRVDFLSDWLSATAILPSRLAETDLRTMLSELTDPPAKGWARDAARMFHGLAAQAESDSAYHLRYGIELRDPTADRRLTELTLQQPEWWRRHQGVNRAVCRTAMADVLPPEIGNRITLGAQLPDWLDRMTEAREEIGVELEIMRDHPASREVIDVARLQALYELWPDRTMMADKKVTYDYQCALIRSVVVSQYIRWFEGRARRVASGGPAVLIREPN